MSLNCDLTEEQLFDYKLKHVYRTAYDVIARRYVRIQRVVETANGLYIIARREIDGQLSRYKPNELIRYR